MQIIAPDKDDAANRAIHVVERMLSTASRCPEDICEWIETEIKEAVAVERERIKALEAMCRAAGYSAAQIAAGTPYVEVMGS